jgi:uncharacterized protein YbbK (DUF523 family)
VKDYPEREPILVSACLLGLQTRYDGRSKRNQKVIDFLQKHQLIAIPVCPEQLAGMPTPREATQFETGQGEDVLHGRGTVVSRSGQSMNDVFCRGAEEVLNIARLTGCRTALFKERSPSCGVHQIYRQGFRVSGMGVTAARLAEDGMIVLSEEDL